MKTPLDNLIAGGKQLLSKIRLHYQVDPNTLPADQQVTVVELNAWYRGVETSLEKAFGSDSHELKTWHFRLEEIKEQEWENITRKNGPIVISRLENTIGILQELKVATMVPPNKASTMEPSPLEISNLRLRLRSLQSNYTGEELHDILEEILALGPAGGELVPELIGALKRGIHMPLLSLVPLIAFFKSTDFLDAALTQYGEPASLHVSEKCHLLKAGFHQFQQSLLDELFRIFQRDDNPCRSEIVEALAIGGTASAIEVLKVIEFRTAARIPELNAELNTGDPAAQAINQMRRGESLAGRRKFLTTVREAITQIGGRPDPQELVLNDMADGQRDAGKSAQHILELLQREEGSQLEFKAALRCDDMKGELDKKLEFRVISAIAAFANREGGTLLLGIDPQKQVVGLKKDYALLKGGQDEFQRHLRQVVAAQCGKVFGPLYLDISFHPIGEAEVCRVDVNRAVQPVWLTRDGKEEFWVRNGNANTLLKDREMADYVAKHFAK